MKYFNIEKTQISVILQRIRGRKLKKIPIFMGTFSLQSPLIGNVMTKTLQNERVFLQITMVIILLSINTAAFNQQSVKTFLNTIERNSKELNAARLLSEVEKLEAYTGIYLSNPEIEYEYVNGEQISGTELIVSQSFEFPTTYGHKKDIARLNAGQAEQTLRSKRREVYTEAMTIYLNQVSNNRKLILYADMENMLLDFNRKALKALELGDITVLESNRIRSETAKTHIDLQKLENNKMALENHLMEINGGIPLNISDTVFPVVLIPHSDDSLVISLIDNNPKNAIWEREINKANSQVSLMKANGLPNFTVGYKQETSDLENAYGFVAGVTIPLFENKNTVKLAKAQSAMLSEEYQSEQLEWQYTYTTLLNTYFAAKLALDEMIELTSEFSTLALLESAYLNGQINYTEFFSEYANYRETLLYIEDLKLVERKLIMEIFVLLSY